MVRSRGSAMHMTRTASSMETSGRRLAISQRRRLLPFGGGRFHQAAISSQISQWITKPVR